MIFIICHSASYQHVFSHKRRPIDIGPAQAVESYYPLIYYRSLQWSFQVINLCAYRSQVPSYYNSFGFSFRVRVKPKQQSLLVHLSSPLFPWLRREDHKPPTYSSILVQLACTLGCYFGVTSESTCTSTCITPYMERMHVSYYKIILTNNALQEPCTALSLS